jgi:hypothetical protein
MKLMPRYMHNGDTTLLANNSSPVIKPTSDSQAILAFIIIETSGSQGAVWLRQIKIYKKQACHAQIFVLICRNTHPCRDGLPILILLKNSKMELTLPSAS